MLYSAAQLTYLENLGIDVWVPKDVPAQIMENTQDLQVNLQGQPPVQVAQTVDTSAAFVSQPVQAPEYAAPAHFEDVPQSTQAPQVSAPVASPAPTAQPSQRSVVNTALNSALTSNIPAPAFPMQAGSNREAATRPQVTFNIQFWCYSSGVWLISGDVDVTPEQHKLVHNLAHFIQGKKRRPRHVNVFSWPMIDSPNVDQGEAIAQKYLLAHIERLQQASEANLVFVFNDCQYFPVQLPHIKLDTTLATLLANPAAKQALWQQLLPHQIRD